MMRKWFLSVVFFAGFIFLLTACSGSSAESQPPSKPVNVRVENNPNPAEVGDITFTVYLTDEKGSPLEGAQVEVALDHTDMMGMTMSGSASEQGGGKYAIQANLSMSGNWKMTVSVKKDGLEYKEDITLTIR
ncbi:MAG: FixH family protein [Chloroflexota bacterium]